MPTKQTEIEFASPDEKPNALDWLIIGRSRRWVYIYDFELECIRRERPSAKSMLAKDENMPPFELPAKIYDRAEALENLPKNEDGCRTPTFGEIVRILSK